MLPITQHKETTENCKTRYINELPLVDRLFADCVVREAEQRGMAKWALRTKSAKQTAKRAGIHSFGWRKAQ